MKGFDMFRHSFIRCSLGVSILAVWAAGCGPSQTGEVVQFGTTKASLIGPPLEYRALALRLEDTFERPVVFRAQPDGAAIGTQLMLGEIPFAIMSAMEYCQVEDRSKLTMLATAVNAAGRTQRKAYIVARAGSSISSTADLKGKRFAYGTRGDMLTDLAVRAALDKAGLPPTELVTEILPPPVAYDGRLYAGREAPNKVAIPILRGDVIPISAAVIDELQYDALPDTGGNIITGPAKDDFNIIGETVSVPEMVVVAGPGADAAQTEALKNYLLSKAGSDENVCKQLEIKGFAAPDKDSYHLACLILTNADQQ